VGNVLFDKCENEMIEIFQCVGHVIGFRLVFDRETGRSWGFGFCKFADHETADTAVRHLNDVPCSRRHLRIVLAESDPYAEGKSTMHGELIDDTTEQDGEVGTRSPGATGNRSALDTWLTGLPQGRPLPAGMNCLDVISATIASIDLGQMMEILECMKTLIMEHPEHAHALLCAYPQLAYMLFQVLLVHRIVPPEILQKMIARTSASPPPSPCWQRCPHCKSPYLFFYIYYYFTRSLGHLKILKANQEAETNARWPHMSSAMSPL
ncbi:hinge domain of cleavage stimulation factor subunit 2-domain-containing protein, partial [Gautieria morchelliformis]